MKLKNLEEIFSFALFVNTTASGNLMPLSDKEIQSYLTNAAEIIIRYRCGTETSFYRRYNKANKQLLSTAWHEAAKRVIPDHIIDNPTDLNSKQEQLANHLYSLHRFNELEKVLHYLRQSSIKQNERSGKIEKRANCLLADNFLYRTDYTLKPHFDEVGFFTNTRNRKIIRKATWPSVILFFLALINLNTIIDGLTPVNVLAEKIHEASRFKHSGSVCNDGTISSSQGSGTCSWHGGVAYEFEKGDYRKTMEQCIEEAKRRSWRD